MARIIGRNRKFISSRFDEGSTVTWEVEQWNNSEHVCAGVWSFVKIRDCDRSICLDFNYDNAREKKQRLKKLDTLIGELQRMRECLEKGAY